MIRAICDRAAPLGCPLLETPRLERAVFLERVNRFVARFRQDAKEGIAHLANPGRLGEILLPGAELLLERRAEGRLRWKVVGAAWTRRWPGDRPRTVFLDPARINHVAERLIRARLIPELRGYSIESRWNCPRTCASRRARRAFGGSGAGSTCTRARLNAD